MTTIRDMLKKGTDVLAQAAGERSTARLDAQVLLTHVLDSDRAAIYAYPECMVTPEQEQRFLELIERRARGEPVAYLVGRKEFYGRDFLVDQRVLIPRPETELLVEVALEAIRQRIEAGRIPLLADIGTGSGAIPITIALEEPRLPLIYACDISTEALEVARLNCQLHALETRVHLLQGDLIAPLPEPVDILTANLPYVGTQELASITPDVHAYEPHLALFSGPDGLVLLRRFCMEVRQSGTLKAGGAMFLEIGYQQREVVARLLQELWPQALVTSKRDYAGWDRLVQMVLK